ncbi:MAG: NAD-dependent epimerase/dehydratase family protein [bacterium]
MSQHVNILVTGAAGFIGWKVCEFLLTKPELIPNNLITQLPNNPMPVNVIGIDNMNDYYDVRLKEWRLEQLKQLNRHCEESSDEAISHNRFHFHKLDIENYDSLKKLFHEYTNTPSSVIASEARQSNTVQKTQNRSEAAKTASKMPQPPFMAVINLAARAGVRYSMENPFVYYTTNVIGTLNLLELCREFGVKKFILASTSSLYAGQKMPFKENLPVNEPISPYAASKKSAEVTCYTYHNLYDIDVTILRYFTVYGPASRPDMSPLRFISWVFQEKPVIIYGDGKQSRDFTYVDDIARGTIMALKPLGFEIINLGGDKPYKLLDFLGMIEKKLGKKAKITHEPTHPADMQATWADITKAKAILKWEPATNLIQGLRKSAEWFVENEGWVGKIEL